MQVILILTIIGIFMTYASARRYMKTGQPMSTKGLTILSGCTIAGLVFLCISLVILLLLFLIYLVEGNVYFLSSGLFIFILSIAANVILLISNVTMRRNIRALRFCLSDTPEYKASVFPAYVLFIIAGLALMGIIMMGFMEDPFLDIYEKSLYSIKRELPRKIRGTFNFYLSIPNSTLFFISSIISIIRTVVQGIVLYMTKSVTDTADHICE